MSCTSPDPPDYCSAESSELKLYQAFIFSVPVFFTFVLLLFFYLFYLRRRRANWQSLRMRANNLIRGDNPRVIGVWFKEGDARNVAGGYLQGELLGQGNTVSNPHLIPPCII
ncbi:hypothetical protein PR202_ga01699 [Eleusine coracana subsp. coracana]|uniref:Uncharacterized protein n=1 Tax=Eleusine coracana subsp. coracana TaxID=191504 RepID=A0AAV5BHS5_ELECO|nr:hypothetical protein PR202_ga01012 [Eleusine coracana subsp. coracana]GJM85892.1 hypothetical protein PR202_ga01699 [Eleusine coracana subsp. coracana]